MIYHPLENLYEGMCYPMEYDQRDLKRMFIWDKEHVESWKPLYNRWKSYLGKLVYPRVHLFLDFMTWMIHRYNSTKMIFEVDDYKIAFALHLGQFQDAFHLSNKGKILDLSLA